MKNSEAPGAANSSNPKRAMRIPSTKTSHQGRVSPLLPADILTLHLPSLVYAESFRVPIIGTKPSPRPVSLQQRHLFLPLFTNVVEGVFSEVRIPDTA